MRKILCTRSIPGKLLQEAEAAGAAIQIFEFITVHACITDEARQQISHLAQKDGAGVVFTSKHAVEAVAACLDALQGTPSPRWTLYCLSEVTRGVAAARFPRAVLSGSGSYAAALAQSILARKNSGEIWFFSGNKRRDTLPETLTQGGILVHEVVVYETELTPRPVPGFFDGILFFSPSGVESYFSQNQPDARSILFAIGETTAAALASYAPNPVVVSPRQQAGALVRTMTDYFTKNDQPLWER